MTGGTIGWAAERWWSSLQPDPTRQNVGDRGAIAQLRRASSINEALAVQATHRLLSTSKVDHYGIEAVVTAAMVLAYVRKDDPETTVAKRLGASGDKRIISPLRFKRLLASRDHSDTLTQFRRLVRMMDDRVNVPDLADSLYDWTDEVRGERRRYRWLLDFHGALEAAEANAAAEAA